MDYETMGKTELRAACKEAGISYGKLTVADMRTALAKAARKAPKEEPVPLATAEAAESAMTTPAPKKERTTRVAREERNGVKRPGPGKCLEVWVFLDANPTATSKDLREIAPSKGWNPNNASIEFYAWRKFNGIAGRASSPAA